MGCSHMHCSMIPQYLYDEYGIASAMATGNAISVVLGISSILFTMDLWVIALAVLCFSALIGYINVMVFHSTDVVREQTGLALSYRRNPYVPPARKRDKANDNSDKP